MRVLIVLAGLVLASCYGPGIEDCQFTCGANMTCPDGTSCMAGVCRSSTGLCPGVTIDAAGSCPAPPAGCTPTFTIPGGCGAVCSTTRLDWTAASLACTAPWRLAVLDTVARVAAAPTTDDFWVGAHRVNQGTPWLWVTGAATDPAVWDQNMIPNAGQGENCATLDRQKHKLVNNFVCTDTLHFLCTEP